jgi:hypothetical protein
MRSKIAVVLMAAFAVTILASAALAQEKLLCVSNETLKGQETVSSCLAKGEKFAYVNQYGIVHILTPQEVALTKAFNPKILETRAFSIKYRKEAPKLPPLPVSPEQP